MRERKNFFKSKTSALARCAGVFLFSVWLIIPCFPSFSVSAQTPYPVNIKQTQTKDLLLSRFTTYFDGENIARSHNIRLACARLNGCTIAADAEFSFNQTVGERTEEQGFMNATVIFEGQFVPGVGGGVCQVSTTLYNAALLAGMVITESHPHSLQVGYVAPSLDAMVSLCSDMKFSNPTKAPVAIRAYTDKNSVTAEIYGKSNGYVYQTESVILYRIPPPPPKVTEGEEDCVIRQEKSGLKSESYLVSYRHGKRCKSIRIRRDTYAFVQGIEKKRKDSLQNLSEDGESVLPKEESLILSPDSFGKIAQNN